MVKLPYFLALTLPLVGFWLARAAVDDMPTRIDATGHQLRWRIEGSGSPTVILEIGLGGPLEEWAAVQSEVARFTRVVAYDRIGARHAAPALSGEDVVRELRAALQNAGIEPPYVLVGQSFGGIYNRLFAAMNPDAVGGLVLVDPSQEEFIAWMREHHPEKEFSRKNHPDWPEANGIQRTLEQLRTCGPLPDVPVTLITAARSQDNALWREVFPVWKSSHQRWIDLQPQGRHVLALDSGHGVHVESPALVAELIREVVLKTRHAAAALRDDQRGTRGTR